MIGCGVCISDAAAFGTDGFAGFTACKIVPGKTGACRRFTEVGMIANIIAVLCIAVWGFFAVRAVVKTHREAKLTGNPGCLGCTGWCSSKGGCHEFSHTEKFLAERSKK